LFLLILLDLSKSSWVRSIIFVNGVAARERRTRLFRFQRSRGTPAG
jgi:hypothetical protein